MSASCIILACLQSFCQKLWKLVEIWRSSDKNNFAQFFETRCSDNIKVAQYIYNKAFIDIRLRPDIAIIGWWWAVHASPYGPLRSNVTSSIKPEVHNISQRCHRRTEPRPQGICTKISWRSVQRFQRYACGQTDRQTHRQTDRNTSLTYWGGVTSRWVRDTCEV